MIDVMDKNEIKEKAIELCVKIFKNQDVDMDLIEYVDFVDDFGMDSISFITLIVEVEELFGIIIPDDLMLMDSLKNVDDIVCVIFEQLRRKVVEIGEDSNDKT